MSHYNTRVGDEDEREKNGRSSERVHGKCNKGRWRWEWNFNIDCVTDSWVVHEIQWNLKIQFQLFQIFALTTFNFFLTFLYQRISANLDVETFNFAPMSRKTQTEHTESNFPPSSQYWELSSCEKAETKVESKIISLSSRTEVLQDFEDFRDISTSSHTASHESRGENELQLSDNTRTN